MPRSLSFLAILVLVGCVTNSPFIGEKQARDLALQASNNGHLSVLQPPERVRAELITLAAARERFGASLGNRNALTPDTMVWVIEMEGAWEINGGPLPPLGTTPTPQTFHHCTVVLDAGTGEEISLTAA